MSGVDHRTLRHFFKKKGLLTDKIGRDWIIYPREIRRRTPGFWKGVLDMERLRQKLGL